VIDRPCGSHEYTEQLRSAHANAQTADLRLIQAASWDRQTVYCS